jgi:hypothetical protein
MSYCVVHAPKHSPYYVFYILHPFDIIISMLLLADIMLYREELWRNILINRQVVPI